MCTGSTLLTENYGVFSEHIGNGDYKEGLVCEWKIKPVAPEGVINLLVYPNSIFGGRVYVWGNNDTNRDPDYLYWGYDSKYYQDIPPISNNYIASYFNFLPYPFNEYAKGDYTQTYNPMLTIHSDEVVLRFYANVPTPFEPYPPGFEHLSGFIFVYWTPFFQSDLTCFGLQDITVSGQGFITDGYGVYSGQDTNLSPTACSWLLTSTQNYFLTIKNFQPIFSGASLKITVGTILTEINSTTIFDIKNVNIAGDYVFWSNFSIPVASGETVLVEYEVPSSFNVARFGESGFVMEYWLDDLELSNMTLTLNDTCLTVDAYRGIGTMQQVRRKFGLDSMTWTVEVAKELDVLVWFKEFNLGTETKDVLSISYEGTDGEVKTTNELMMNSPYQPLIIIPSPKIITIEYQGNSMNHRGFSIVIGFMSDFHNCTDVNAVPLSTQGNNTISLTPLDGNDHIFYSSSSAPFASFLTSGADLKTTQLWGGNRCLVFSNRAFNWNFYIDMPDANLKYILIWIKTFSIKLEPITLNVRITYPHLKQKKQKFSNERVIVASGKETAYLIYDNLLIEYKQNSGFTPVFDLGFDSNNVRGIVKSGSTLYINSLSQDISQNSKSDVRKFNLDDFEETEDSPIATVSGDFFGHAMSVSPSGYWFAGYHSPGIFKFYLKNYNPWVYLSKEKYSDWSYPPFVEQLVTATKLTDDLFVASVCTFDGKVGVVLGVLCYMMESTLCYYSSTSHLQSTDWYLLDIIYLPGTCSESSSMSIDIMREAENEGILIMVGSPSSQFVTVMLLDGIPSTRNGLYLDYLNSLLDGIKMTTIENTEDTLFGSDVSFSPKTSEILIMGSRLYTFLLDEVLLYSSIYEDYDFPVTSIQDFSSVTFVPNRFFLNNEDWSKNTFPQIAFTTQNLFILQISEDSPQIHNISVTGIGNQIKVQPNTTTNEQPCPIGSYKPSLGFGRCVLCPSGYFQNVTGASKCNECQNNSYCPIGSIVDVPLVKEESRSFTALPKFTIYATETLDSVWVSVFYKIAWLAAPLYIIWGTSILLFFYIVMAKRGTDGKPLPGIGGKIESIFNCMDPDPKSEFNPTTNKNEETFSLEAALLNMILYTFLILATIYIVYFFSSYRQYGGEEIILNNVRTSSLRPYFTYNDNEKAILKYMKSRGIELSLLITGYFNIDCEEICNSKDLKKNFISTGCYREDGTICSHSPVLSCTSINEHQCNITWNLPTNIELLLQSSFKFPLANSYVQSVNISIKIPAEESPSGVEIPPSDSLVITESYTFDSVRLRDPNKLLFGLGRTYDLSYVLQASEQVKSASSTDWKTQAIFLPSQQRSVDTTTPLGYLQTNVPNSVTLYFHQQNYFVSNVEARFVSSGQLFLQIVLVITGVVGVFDLFTKGVLAAHDFISPGNSQGNEDYLMK